MSAADILCVVCGMLSGIALGLVGGGGSILATPLLMHVVRIGDPHVAVGTSAVAVAVAALCSFLTHARAGHVRWRSGSVFAVTGVVGALIGSTLGKAFDGQKLLFLFGILMLVVGIKLLRGHEKESGPDYGRRSDRVVAGLALVAGLASGFFGIGGGFLIVPCLLYATTMPMIDAVGTSLLAVVAFSIATAATYAYAGLVDWPVAGWFVCGGILGGGLGMLGASQLASHESVLRRVFAVVILLAAVYVMSRSVSAMM